MKASIKNKVKHEIKKTLSISWYVKVHLFLYRKYYVFFFILVIFSLILFNMDFYFEIKHQCFLMIKILKSHLWYSNLLCVKHLSIFEMLTLQMFSKTLANKLKIFYFLILKPRINLWQSLNKIKLSKQYHYDSYMTLVFWKTNVSSS